MPCIRKQREAVRQEAAHHLDDQIGRRQSEDERQAAFVVTRRGIDMPVSMSLA